jgi:hypothetical protein
MNAAQALLLHPVVRRRFISHTKVKLNVDDKVKETERETEDKKWEALTEYTKHQSIDVSELVRCAG